jgi:DNA-binding transcriptional LysR family regulator
VEPLLSVVITDTYSLSFYGELLANLSKKFPDTELRCGPSEDADVIRLIQADQAHIGILATQSSYPLDIAVARLPAQAKFSVYVNEHHQLARLEKVRPQDLEEVRHLRIRTYAPSALTTGAQTWSAPDYLTLMELAGRGFGWAELPTLLVDRFGKGLVELKLPGYPKGVDIDVAWSRRKPLGLAGQWLVEQMTSAL